jgi:hypothetical protein
VGRHGHDAHREPPRRMKRSRVTSTGRTQSHCAIVESYEPQRLDVMRGTKTEAVPVWAALLLFFSCKAEETVKCGAGTVLKDGVCEVVIPTAPAPVAAVPVGQAPPDANAAVTPVGPAWQYHEKLDQMRNAKVRFAALDSKNAAQFRPPYDGGSRLRIMLRNGDKASGMGLDAFIVIERGQFDCDLRGCTVAYKFDDGKVGTFWMNRGNDSQSLFVTTAAGFIGLLKKSKVLMLEAEFYQDGKRQFEFDVAGLEFDLPETTKPVAKPRERATREYVDDNVEDRPKTVKDYIVTEPNE